MTHFVNLSKNEFSSKIAGRQFLHNIHSGQKKSL